MRFESAHRPTKSLFYSFVATVAWSSWLVLLAGPGCSSHEKSPAKKAHATEEDEQDIPDVPSLEQPQHGARVKQTFSKELEQLAAKNDPAKRAKLVTRIRQGTKASRLQLLGTEIVAVNTSTDGWTVGGDPAGLLLDNTSKVAAHVAIQLVTGAPKKVYPLTALLDDGKKKIKVVFEHEGIKRVAFPPLAPDSHRLYLITTDKTWTPGTHDERELGVQLRVAAAPLLAGLVDKPNPGRRVRLLAAILSGKVTDAKVLVGPHTVAVGLDRAGWIKGKVAGVAVKNARGKPLTPRITLSCNAPKKRLPITVTIDGGGKRTKHTFDKPGAELVTLPAVPARSKQLFVVSLDKKPTSGTGANTGFGVQIANPLDGALQQLLAKNNWTARSKLIEELFTLEVQGKLHLLEKMVVAVGLTSDRWTLGGRPAAIAVRNPGDAPMELQLEVSCGASKPKDLPVTAIVDDGETSKKLEFKGPSTKQVSVSVPASSEKLFIISADKTWVPGEKDPRPLGVQVGVKLDKVRL